MSLSGKDAAGKLADACAEAGLVILADWAEVVPVGCGLIDMKVLAGTGPLALWTDVDGLRLERTRTATRLWSPPVRRHALPDLSRGGASRKLAAGQ